MRLWMLTLCFLGMAVALKAQDAPIFTASVNTDSLLMGNPLRVVFTLKNANSNAIEFPDFDGFQLRSGPNVSTSMQFVNGTMSQQSSYTFLLEPTDVGVFYIAPASVQVDGQWLETTPITIQVVPNPDGLTQPASEMPDDFGGFFQFDMPAMPRSLFDMDLNDFWGGSFFDNLPSPDLWNTTPPEQVEPPVKKRKTTKI